MKKRYYITTVLVALFWAQLNVSAQEIKIKDKIVEKADTSLVIGMTINFTEIEVPSNQSIVCTPVIVHDDSIRPLIPVIINGRNRHILYERTGRNFVENQEIELRRHNGKSQTLDYQVHTPFAKWMEKSEVTLVVDECGCGWDSLLSTCSPLFAINLAEPIVLKPLLVFATPKTEAVKARSKEGSAFLDFPVNKVMIYPNYRNNPQELRKIRETIDSVQGNKYATITEVCIKGYASPEGSYLNNTYLAENRAKALSDYVNGLYHFKHATFTVDFEPEDWDGLEKRLVTMNLADKDELLAIIRANDLSDLDKKEWKLKALNGGASYKILLRDVYPALRHSDYEVKYTIRNFSVEEAKELLYTDPKQLSLNEMFQVAQTFELGSWQFGEVFEIAVRMYPDDPVSNLNAANIAIQNGQIEQAKRYLSRAVDTPEKKLAEAALLMLKGNLDEAETILSSLKDNVGVSEAVINNLEQIRLKREE